MILKRLWMAAIFCPAPILCDWNYEEHVFFENSLTDRSYFSSEGSFTSPSSLTLAAGRLPVEESSFFSPPNSLRLQWKSAPGGSWRATVHLRKWRNQDIRFAGDALSFWAMAAREVPGDALPAVSLEDLDKNRTGPLPLGAAANALPGGRWTQIRVPLARFSTAGKKVDWSRIKSIHFSQAGSDSIEHLVLLDEIKFDGLGNARHAPPAPPSSLTAQPYALHVDLEWTPPETGEVQHYQIYRSFDGDEYRPVGIQKGYFRRYADFVGETGKKVHYRIGAIDPDYQESELSETAAASTRAMSDEEILDMVQKACILYYWESSHPAAALALENIPGDKFLVAAGASGFGILALIVGMERGFIPRRPGAERLLRAVHFLEKADRFHGAWPHFLDGVTGKVIPLFGKYDDGGDLVETAFLMQGLLAARQYFTGSEPMEQEIRLGITRLWETVEWEWYRRSPDSDFLFWHWSPDHSWHLDHPLIGWNETLIAYLLAIASPAHPVPASVY